MNTLVIDIGGTHVKIWRSEDSEKVKLPSGKKLTPETLIDGIKDELKKWAIDRVSIGYPGEART